MFLGFILKLPIYGAPADTECFEDSIYWEVNDSVTCNSYCFKTCFFSKESRW